MLLHFGFKNFRSFKGPQLFSMVAFESLKTHNDRLIFANSPKTKILPVTAIFGANAFGKSNFIEALRFIKDMITDPADPGSQIPVEPFFLDPKTERSPTFFEMIIFAEETQYEIVVKLNAEKIIEEKVSIIKNRSKKNIYHRKNKSCISGKFGQGGYIKKAMETSEENALLLSNHILQKTNELAPIYRWFTDTLLIVSTDTKFTCYDGLNHFTEMLGEALRLLDVGIEGMKEIPVRKSNTFLPREQIKKIETLAKSGKIVQFKNPHNDTFIMRNENNKLVTKLLGIVKKDRKSNELNISTRKESSGTRHLVDILPGILQLDSPGKNRVLIIDELDKSLHFETTHGLLNYHLDSLENQSRSQLIFTTHDTGLIKDTLLRNDEIWIIDKDHDGVSEMIRLTDFKRNKTGMTFQQLYKAGNLGGSPQIFLLSQEQLAEIAQVPHRVAQDHS